MSDASNSLSQQPHTVHDPNSPAPPDDDSAWENLAMQWRLRDGTIYLNHGSFGPPPEPVRRARAAWQERLDSQPMDFFVREFESAWHAARRRLADFTGTSAENLVFVANATAAMNIVAGSVRLNAGDEVLLTDHEYGAVRRIWERACRRAGANLTTATLPLPFESAEQVVEAIFHAATSRTKLLVVSHVTSPTAVILPMQQIATHARRRGIALCVDGPHAIAQVDLQLDALGCDYYAASCHKWLSAPFGSGFLYVHPQQQPQVQPVNLSWGIPPPREPSAWWEEFFWSGTADPSAYLAVPAAIEFLQGVGCQAFRTRTHWLARYARQRLMELTGLVPLMPDDPQWYGSMAHLPLPPGDSRSLQTALWERRQIEVPIIAWNGGRFIRISCHLYNSRGQIDALTAALAELLRTE